MKIQINKINFRRLMLDIRFWIILTFIDLPVAAIIWNPSDWSAGWPLILFVFPAWVTLGYGMWAYVLHPVIRFIVKGVWK